MPPTQSNRALRQLYIFLAKSFGHPTDELYAAMANGSLMAELRSLACSLPFPLKIQGDFAPSFSRDDFESEYINFFDLSYGSLPLCPLYESCHRDDVDRSEIHEDVIRFWEHFGAGPCDQGRDYPDHLVAELEFLALLLTREAGALDAGKSPESYRLAQLEFLERHLGVWLGKFDEKVQARARERFYRAASSLLKDMVERHLAYLRETLARVPQASTPDGKKTDVHG